MNYTEFNWLLCVPFRETVQYIRNMRIVASDTMGALINSCVFLAPVVSIAPLGVNRRLHVPDTSTCGDQTYNIYYALMCALNFEQYLIQRHITNVAMKDVLLACNQPLQPLFAYYTRFYVLFNCIAPDTVCMAELNMRTTPVLWQDVSGVAVIRPHLGLSLKPSIYHFKTQLPITNIKQAISTLPVVFPTSHAHLFTILDENILVTIDWLRNLDDVALRNLHPVMLRTGTHAIAPPLEAMKHYLVMTAVCLRIALVIEVMRALGSEVSSRDLLNTASQLGPEEHTYRKTRIPSHQFHSKVLGDIPMDSLLEVHEANRLVVLHCRLFILTHLPLVLNSIKDDKTICTDMDLAVPVLPNHCLSKLEFWFPYPDRVYHVHDQPSHSLMVMQTSIFTHDPRNRSKDKDVDCLKDFFVMLDRAPDRPLSMAHVTHIKAMLRMDVAMHRFVCDGLWAGLLGLYASNTVILSVDTYMRIIVYVRQIIALSLADLGNWIKQHFRIFELCMYMKYIHTVNSLPPKQEILRTRYIHYDQWVQNCTDAINIALFLTVAGDTTMQINQRFLADHIRFDYLGRRMTSKVKLDWIGNINTYLGNFCLIREATYMTVLTFTEALQEIMESEQFVKHIPKPRNEQDPDHIAAMNDLVSLMSITGNTPILRDATFLIGFGVNQDTAICISRYIRRLCSNMVTDSITQVAHMPVCTWHEIDLISYWIRAIMWRTSMVAMSTAGTGFQDSQLKAMRHLVHVDDYQYMHNLTNILTFAKKGEMLNPLYSLHYGHNTMTFDIIGNDFVPTKSDPGRTSTRLHLLHRVEQTNALGAVIWTRRFERLSAGRSKGDMLTRVALKNCTQAYNRNNMTCKLTDRVPDSNINALMDRDRLSGVVLADCCGVYSSTTNASGPWANSTFWCGRCTTHTNWEHFAFVCDMCHTVLGMNTRRDFISCLVFDVHTETMEIRVYCIDTCCSTTLVQNTLLHNSGLVVESMVHYAINQAEDMQDIGMGLMDDIDKEND